MMPNQTPKEEYGIGEAIRDLTERGGLNLTKSRAREILERLLAQERRRVWERAVECVPDVSSMCICSAHQNCDAAKDCSTCQQAVGRSDGYRLYRANVLSAMDGELKETTNE